MPSLNSCLVRMPATALWLFLLCASTAQAGPRVHVYAAASLTNAIEEISLAWSRAGGPRPTVVLAASSALAKQIENGAPADIFASADLEWMDYLAERRRIDPSSRVDLLRNELVLIAPKGRGVPVTLDKRFDLAAAFEGRLCTGEPGIVPAGTYARQALLHYGWWPSLARRVVGTDDVRTALTFVERGECPLGIVYATDAAISTRVTVVGRFPAGCHDPIVYPFALTTGAAPQARPFFEYLRSEAALEIFRKHGFFVAVPNP